MKTDSPLSQFLAGDPCEAEHASARCKRRVDATGFSPESMQQCVFRLEVSLNARFQGTAACLSPASGKSIEKGLQGLY
jgi:hypothetical protein